MEQVFRHHIQHFPLIKHLHNSMLPPNSPIPSVLVVFQPEVSLMPWLTNPLAFPSFASSAALEFSFQPCPSTNRMPNPNASSAHDAQYSLQQSCMTGYQPIALTVVMMACIPTPLTYSSSNIFPFLLPLLPHIPLPL